MALSAPPIATIDHGYREQIDAAVSELMLLERDAAWSYHSVKQNVLISQLNGAPASSNLLYSTGSGLNTSNDGHKEYHKVRGQGIVHAPPETTFNCISDLDMYAMWDGFGNEQQVIAEHSLDEDGLVRILYIRFNGIFPVASRDICVCTIKRRISARNHPKMAFKGSGQTLARSGDDMNTEAFLLAAFSIDHPSCPPAPGFVRADLRSSGFIIRPLANSSCSSVTYIIQFNAKGWLPTALSSMVSEYQPLRIAKIRDIAHTYQYTHNGTSKSGSNTSDASANTSSSRFGWMQQCRGALREEEEFIAAERQALDEASTETLKSKLRPIRYNASSSSLSSVNKKQSHHRSASSGSGSGKVPLEAPTPSAPLLRPLIPSYPESRSRSHEYIHHSHDGRMHAGEGEGGEMDLGERSASLQSAKRSRKSKKLKHHASASAQTAAASSSNGPNTSHLEPAAAGYGVSSADSDSEEVDMEVASDDSSPFYDVTSDLHDTELLQLGAADGLPVVVKILHSDVEHIKSVQFASQHKLEAIEANLKGRSAENAHLVDHLDGLKSFLSACMDKLRTYSNEHKAMEAMRIRWEAKWHARLASVAQKLKDAQRGYWTPRRARQAAFYRYCIIFFLVIIWPAIFIRAYAILQKPQRFLTRCTTLLQLLSNWLLSRRALE